jgi:hypothetical protein
MSGDEEGIYDDQDLCNHILDCVLCLGRRCGAGGLGDGGVAVGGFGLQADSPGGGCVSSRYGPGAVRIRIHRTLSRRGRTRGPDRTEPEASGASDAPPAKAKRISGHDRAIQRCRLGRVVWPDGIVAGVAVRLAFGELVGGAGRLLSCRGFQRAAARGDLPSAPATMPRRGRAICGSGGAGPDGPSTGFGGRNGSSRPEAGNGNFGAPGCRSFWRDTRPGSIVGFDCILFPQGKDRAAADPVAGGTVPQGYLRRSTRITAFGGLA